MQPKLSNFSANWAKKQNISPSLAKVCRKMYFC